MLCIVLFVSDVIILFIYFNDIIKENEIWREYKIRKEFVNGV